MKNDGLDLLIKQKGNDQHQSLTGFDDHDDYAREFSVGVVNFGSKCNLKCFYCSQEHNPRDINPQTVNFLSVDKIKKYLELVPERHIAEIGSTMWTWAGEFLLHPNSLELLKYLENEKFIVNTVSTNGMLLTEGHAEILKKIITGDGVGLHLCNYNQTKTGLDLLDRYEVPYQVVIVPTRAQIDNGRIEKWIEQLQVHNPKYIGILKPSYTKHNPPRMAQQMDISDEELKFHISNWKKTYTKTDIIYQSRVDDFAIINSLDTFMATVFANSLSYTGTGGYVQDTSTSSGANAGMQFKPILNMEILPRILFLTSGAVKGIFERILEFKKEMHMLIDGITLLQNSKVVTVENSTFGGNCNVSGLLLVDDYISAIDQTIENGYDPEWIVMPHESFWYEKKDLKGIPVDTIGKNFGDLRWFLV